MAVGARNITGAAGEYFVAAELSRRGWLATVTIKNSPDTDVLGQWPETEALVAIQTKTASPGNHFRLHKKNEAPAKRDGQWFVLVALGREQDHPRYYVVPRNHIAAMVYLEHQEWLSKPGPGGRAHRENDQRVLKHEDVVGYLERWDLLRQPTANVRFLGAERFLLLAKTHGLPVGHPGLLPRKADARAPRSKRPSTSVTTARQSVTVPERAGRAILDLLRDQPHGLTRAELEELGATTIPRNKAGFYIAEGMRWLRANGHQITRSGPEGTYTLRQASPD
jgi:hypothetical protein